MQLKFQHRSLSCVFIFVLEAAGGHGHSHSHGHSHGHGHKHKESKHTEPTEVKGIVSRVSVLKRSELQNNPYTHCLVGPIITVMY